jgi:hypothetical protein
MNPWQIVLSTLNPASDPEIAFANPEPPKTSQGSVAQALKNREVLRKQLVPEGEAGGGFDPIGKAMDNPLTNMLREAFARARQDPSTLDPIGPITAPASSGPSSQTGVQPAKPSSIPGTTIGSMPDPVSDQAKARAMFEGGSQQPTSASPSDLRVIPPMRPAPEYRGSMQPAQQPGLMELLSGMKSDPTANAIADILHGAMRGAAMNVNNPRGQGVGAFGAGWTGAVDDVRKRDKEKAAADLASQKLKFDQGIEVRKDARSEKELGLKTRDQTRKESETAVNNRAAIDKIMQSRAGHLSLENKIKLQDQVTQHIDKLNKNGMMGPAEIEAAVEKKVKQLERYYSGQGQTPAAPSAKPPTATGPNGQKMIFQNGRWEPFQ